MIPKNLSSRNCPHCGDRLWITDRHIFPKIWTPKRIRWYTYHLLHCWKCDKQFCIKVYEETTEVIYDEE